MCVFPHFSFLGVASLGQAVFFRKCGKTRQRHLRCLSFCGRKLDWNWTALEMWGKQHRIFSEVNSRIRRVCHTHSYINILLAWFNTPIQNTILNWIELWCICFHSAGICWSKFQCYLLYCFSWYDRAILFYNYYLSDVSGTYLQTCYKKVPEWYSVHRHLFKSSCDNSGVFFRPQYIQYILYIAEEKM